MLPAIDDGAPDLETALAMARLAIADGIETTACTPHIYPGLYENTAQSIRAGMEAFGSELARAGLRLDLVCGADTHLVPDLLAGLRAGRIPTLAGSRYLLLEPPHHVAPPRFEESCFGLLAAGYVPVITHPERLTWIQGHYAKFQALAQGGVWMQVTAGSLAGRFGPGARYYGERMLDEGIVHLLATDAHNTGRRAPALAEGRREAARWVGEEEAGRLVRGRPQAILDNADPAAVAPPPGLRDPGGTPRPEAKPSLWARLFQRARRG